MRDFDCVLFILEQSSDGSYRSDAMESLIASDTSHYQRPWRINCKDRKALILDRKKAVEASARWKVPLVSPMLQYLARSSADLHSLYDELHRREVQLRILRFGRKLMDSRDLANLHLNDFMLAFAEFESDLARERTFKATNASKEAPNTGKQPIKDEIKDAVKKEHASGLYSAEEIAKRHNIGRSTVFKIVKENT